jgi:hypothetical protein
VSGGSKRRCALHSRRSVVRAIVRAGRGCGGLLRAEQAQRCSAARLAALLRGHGRVLACLGQDVRRRAVRCAAGALLCG